MRTIDLNGQRDVYICIDLGLEVYQQGPVGTNKIRVSNIPANRQDPGIIRSLSRGDEPSQVASDGVGHWPTGRPSRRTSQVPGVSVTLSPVRPGAVPTAATAPADPRPPPGNAASLPSKQTNVNKVANNPSRNPLDLEICQPGDLCGSLSSVIHAGSRWLRIFNRDGARWLRIFIRNPYSPDLNLVVNTG